MANGLQIALVLTGIVITIVMAEIHKSREPYRPAPSTAANIHEQVDEWKDIIKFNNGVESTSPNTRLDFVRQWKEEKNMKPLRHMSLQKVREYWQMRRSEGTLRNMPLTDKDRYDETLFSRKRRTVDEVEEPVQEGRVWRKDRKRGFLKDILDARGLTMEDFKQMSSEDRASIEDKVKQKWDGARDRTNEEKIQGGNNEKTKKKGRRLPLSPDSLDELKAIKKNRNLTKREKKRRIRAFKESHRLPM